MQESMDFVNAQKWPALMESYIKELEADLENGGLPKSSENQNAISTIRNVSRDLFAIPEPSEEGPKEAALEKFFEYQMQRKPFEARLLNAWLVLRGKEMMSLRPEATASVCRAYIEHNMQQLPQPQKLYYIGPMFRRERPQKGRYRQFYQIGAEVLENVKPDPTRDAAKELAKDAITDAELIQMLMTFFDRLRLPGVQLEINSIGHAAD